MANNENEAPVLSETEARAGVTGHHVRYVLAFGLVGSAIAFVGIWGCRSARRRQFLAFG
jgi:hypothetical protein